MNEPDPADARDLRISDSDRHRVAEVLREAAGDGRIDLEELDQRLEATYAAKTYGDLVPITLDLPAHTDVRVEGTGIMGSYTELRAKVDAVIDQQSPVVRVRGIALMGSVDVRRRGPR